MRSSGWPSLKRKGAEGKWGRLYVLRNRKRKNTAAAKPAIPAYCAKVSPP